MSIENVPSDNPRTGRIVRAQHGRGAARAGVGAESRNVIADLPHRCHATRETYVRILAMRFLFASEHEARHCQKRRRALDLRRMNPAVEGRITTIGDGARPAANLLDSLPAIKGSRTPTDAGLPACLKASAHPAGRARLSAFHGGSALGTHASQGAVSDQVSRRWRLSGGGLPPAPTPVTASTSHAGHSAGGLDVRYRPSATGTNPLRAGTASRSRQPESPADVLARGARGWRFYS